MEIGSKTEPFPGFGVHLPPPGLHILFSTEWELKDVTAEGIKKAREQQYCWGCATFLPMTPSPAPADLARTFALALSAWDTSVLLLPRFHLHTFQPALDIEILLRALTPEALSSANPRARCDCTSQVWLSLHRCCRKCCKMQAQILNTLHRAIQPSPQSDVVPEVFRGLLSNK